MRLSTTMLATAAMAVLWIAPGSAFAAMSGACAAMPSMDRAPAATFTEATNLMSDIEVRSTNVATTADELVFTSVPSTDTWQFQTQEVATIKSDINKMGKDLCRLKEMRASLPMWEQHAIDLLYPRLAGMANNTSNAIQFINSSQTALWRPELRRYESAVDSQAHNLTRMADTYVDYARVHKRDQQLARSLNITAS